MNRKQKIALCIGLAVILLMGIFPAWVSTLRRGAERDAGYSCIIDPPYLPDAWTGVQGIKLDVPRLCLQGIVVAIVTADVSLAVRDKKNH